MRKRNCAGESLVGSSVSIRPSCSPPMVVYSLAMIASAISAVPTAVGSVRFGFMS